MQGWLGPVWLVKLRKFKLEEIGVAGTGVARGRRLVRKGFAGDGLVGVAVFVDFSRGTR